jgi:hypothetical protein
VLFDVFLFPFKALPPIVGLLVLSIVLGIVFLLLFKYTSPQKTIKKIKNRIKAGLYEVRLYKDDLGIIFRANKSLMVNNGLYISCCIIPLAPMIILILPVLVQLDSRYGHSPLQKGETTIVKVVLSESVDFNASKVDLDVPKGLKIEAGPVRIPTRNEYAYRLRVEEDGHYDLNITVDGETYAKSIDAQEGLDTVSPLRMKATLGSFWFPAEKAWPVNAPLERVEVTHARKEMIGMPGDIYPWLIIFCVVAIAAGFAMKGVFKVNI